MSTTLASTAVDDSPATSIQDEEAIISPSPESLTNEELASIAIGAFSRIQDSMPYILELRKRFQAAPRGKANIQGCGTWGEFCEKHLYRTPRAVRKAIESHNNPPTNTPPQSAEAHEPDEPDELPEPVRGEDKATSLSRLFKPGFVSITSGRAGKFYVTFNLLTEKQVQQLAKAVSGFLRLLRALQ